ncbi:MAG: alpha/beta hydrolase, partial [Bacteroidota bacterium]
MKARATNTQDFRETRFTLSSGTLAAKLWGPENGLPVLALHGWLDNANTFDLLAKELPGIRLVALDLAGHGLSAHRPAGGSYYLWDHLADVAEVVQQLGWQRFSLVGHSMGAGIACWFAGTFVDKVDRLVLIDGFGAPFSVESESLPGYLRKAIRRRMLAFKSPIARFAEGKQHQFSSFDEAVAERRNGKFGKLTDEAAAILLRRGLEAVEGGYRWRNDPRLTLPAYMEPNEAAIHAFIRKITAPTCLILGNQGLFGKGEKAERLQAFSQLELHRLPGDHHLHLGPHATEVGQTVRKFLVSSP